MPEYQYQNPQTGEIINLIQSVKEPHIYISNGVTWNRIFTPPQVGVDTKFDEFNSKDFATKTGKKKGSLGDLWDKSEELSEKRKDKEGFDAVQDAYIKKERQRRKGKPSQLEIKKARKELGIEV